MGTRSVNDILTPSNIITALTNATPEERAAIKALLEA
jgi:hypothetical protein